tara:strand:+ start:541 stop:978 length:438 start_codon:yes stop_codon:yes gene_type:complete
VKWLNKDFLGRRKEKGNSSDEDAKKAFDRARRAGRVDVQNKKKHDDDEHYLKEAMEIVDSGVGKEYDTGQRTIPSKIIPKTDRSDRLGEDREFMDRFKAEEEIRKGGEEISESKVEKLVGERKAKREELDNLLSGLDQLIDDEKE